MNSLDKIEDLRSDDPFDRLIFEDGLRAVDLRIYKKLDLMVVVLNSGKALEINLSGYPKLKRAPEKELKKWKLVFGGEGFEWKGLNYDLSLKGFLQKAALKSLEYREHNITA